MKFRVTDGFEEFKATREPNIILRRDGWDDFGFKTLFRAEFIEPDGNVVELGNVKILQAGQDGGKTKFDKPVFTALDDRYCSLGQDIEYYEKLALLPKGFRNRFLSSMRDAAVSPEIARMFEDELGWETSLLRFGQAEHTLLSAISLFDENSRAGNVVSFTHNSSELDASFKFTFEDSGYLPGRAKVLIGYNGVGKTRLLGEIARDTSKVGMNAGGGSSKEAGLFSSVIAISYSAFDSFELPPIRAEGELASEFGDDSETTRFGYTYCGLRQVSGDHPSNSLKSIREIDSEFVSAFRIACERNAPLLTQVLAVIESDPSFGRSGVSMAEWVATQELPVGYPERLSSGQKIVLNIVAQLLAHLRRRSLVLVDEPETHLHPPLLAALLRGINLLLDAFDSFAIVATHSPVVLQEVPAKDVQVVERFGDIVRATTPRLETFAAGLGELTHEAFGLDNSVSDHRAVIKQLVGSIGVEGFEALFPDGINGQARALALRAKREL